MKDFSDSISKLSLESCILVIGLLSQRSLELMVERKDSNKESSIIVPNVSLSV